MPERQIRRYCARVHRTVADRVSILLMLTPLVLVYLPAGLSPMLFRVPLAIRRTSGRVTFRSPIALLATPLIVVLYVVIAVWRGSLSTGALVWFAAWVWLLAPWASISVVEQRALRIQNLRAREVPLQDVRPIQAPKAPNPLQVQLASGARLSVRALRPLGGASKRWIEHVAQDLEMQRSALARGTPFHGG